MNAPLWQFKTGKTVLWEPFKSKYISEVSFIKQENVVLGTNQYLFFNVLIKNITNSYQT